MLDRIPRVDYRLYGATAGPCVAALPGFRPDGGAGGGGGETEGFEKLPACSRASSSWFSWLAVLPANLGPLPVCPAILPCEPLRAWRCIGGVAEEVSDIDGGGGDAAAGGGGAIGGAATGRG
jgi:hypothetical protein